MNWVNHYLEKMTGNADKPARPAFVKTLFCGLGATLAIAPMALLTNISDLSFLMAPFGASCFLAFTAPENPLSQPRNIIFGHFISTAVGLLILTLFGSNWASMAIAVGLAVILMQLSNSGHPPAGADPLVVLLIEPDWYFLLFPVLSGSIILVLVAMFFTNLRPGMRYPKYW